MGWSSSIDVEDAVAAFWPEADVSLETEVLTALFAVAGEQCENFAPALGVDEDQPQSWTMAVTLQARSLYQAGFVNSGDSVGMDGVQIQIFPMSWHVKNLLRPKRIPVLG